MTDDSTTTTPNPTSIGNQSRGSAGLPPPLGPGWVPYERDGKSFGRISPDGRTFHVLKREKTQTLDLDGWPAYAIQRACLKHLLASGVEWVRCDLQREDALITYWVPAAWWWAAQTPKHYSHRDGGQAVLTRHQLERFTLKAQVEGPIGRSPPPAWPPPKVAPSA